jgi:transcription elongation factor Elf1
MKQDEIIELVEKFVEVKIIPCAFCKSNKFRLGETEGSYFIVCKNCGASGPQKLKSEYDAAKIEAAKAWNIRAL